MPDGSGAVVAGWSEHGTQVPTGTGLPVDELVRHTRAPVRLDDTPAVAVLAKAIRERGIHAGLAAPVVVDANLWGTLLAGWGTTGGPNDGAELRLARFAELVATAVANATTRSELIASRARIVTAGDEARRRVERDLHDGAQQRLVALGLDLERLGDNVAPEQSDVRSDLESIRHELEGVLDDLRELSRGLHPALLHEGGLRPSLRSLARRSPVPVRVDVDLPDRPDEAIEVAVYYVVAEALTNVAKHARASDVVVTVSAADDRVHAAIQDDGVGGAKPGPGSGLVGLTDRVVALGGRMTVSSPAGQGTNLSVDLPLHTSIG
jgi:signal transduction histidine kinase